MPPTAGGRIQIEPQNRATACPPRSQAPVWPFRVIGGGQAVPAPPRAILARTTLLRSFITPDPNARLQSRAQVGRHCTRRPAYGASKLHRRADHVDAAAPSLTLQ